MPPPMTVSAVLGDAWNVYRLLFRRSIAVAVVVYALLNAAQLLHDNVVHGSVRSGLAIISFVLLVGGPIIVQGALVKIVQSVHEGNRPEEAVVLVRAAWSRIGSLIGASLIYAFGVIVGLLLLVVPGLLAAARWSLMAPAIMLEGHYAMPARERSSKLVRGEVGGLGNRTWFVLGVIVVAWLLATVPTAVVWGSSSGFWGWALWFVSAAWSTVVAPYQAHVLSVLYYRLVDPEQPAVDPHVWSWPSVWQGPVAETA